MQGWFSGGPSASAAAASGGGGDPPSLLSDWNTYAASRTQETSISSQLSLDLESAMPESIAPLLKSANTTLIGAFNS